MAVLSDLTSKISDEIDDTSGEYGAQILDAVQEAQRFCERSTYYLNETRDVTFATVADQQWYGSADNANIPTLIKIQAAYVTDSDNRTEELDRETPEALELLGDGTAAKSKPLCFTYFNRQIRLYPVPDAATYTIRLQLGPYRLTVLVSPSDSNAWLDEAFDLIKARAKYILYKNVLKEPALAAEALNDWRDQDNALTGETALRNGSGFVTPSQF